MKRPEILIVEDEAIIREDIANKLRKLGYGIGGLTNTGEEAVEIACRKRPALVLMDIRLAGPMDGIKAAALIRQNCQLPVIFLTAHSDMATIRNARQTEPFGYIQKPFMENELRTQIEMALFKHDAEQRLLKNQARLETFTAATFEGIVEMESGKIVDCNEQFANLIGCPSSELIGLSIDRLIAPEDVDRVMENIRKARESVSEYMMIRKDGRRIEVEAHGRSMPEGRRIAAIRDVSERKRIMQLTEKALNDAVREKNQLEAALKAFPVGMAIINKEGQFIRINKIFDEILGPVYSFKNDINSDTLFKAMWLESGNRVESEEWISSWAQQRDANAGGQLMEIVSPEGISKIIYYNGAPVYDDKGRIIGSAIAVQDITDLKRIEAEILNRTSELEGVFSAQNDAVIMYDTEMNIKQVNPAFLSKYGFDPVGLNLKEIIQKVSCKWLDGRPFVLDEQPTPRALHGEKVTGSLFSITLPDGGERFIETSSGPMRQGDRITGTVTVWHDITELKRAEDALRASESRFRLLSEISDKLLKAHDPQDVINELCRQVMIHLDCHVFFNFLVDNVRGCLRLNSWAGIPDAEAQQIEFLEFGVAVCGCVAEGGSRIIAEHIATTMDSRTELVKSYGVQAYACHPLLVEDRVIGTLSFGTKTRASFSSEDIALMKTVADQISTAFERMRLIEDLKISRAELEMRVKERTAAYKSSKIKYKNLFQEFQTLLHAISDTLILISPEMKILWTNGGNAYRLNDAQSNMVGELCYRLFYDRSSPCEECPATVAFKTGITEAAIRSHNGCILEKRAFPIKKGKRIGSILLVISDITEKMSIQAEMMAASHLASLGELAAGVAHEINNPITGIINYGQILINESGTDNMITEMGKRIVKEGDRISQIVRTLLSYARDRGQEKQPIQVVAIVKESLILSHSQIRKEGITVKVSFPDDFPEIYANFQQIQQVFINILTNARYALNEKYPGRDLQKRIEITGEKTEVNDNHFARIVFYDRGTGISDVKLDQLTKPFFSTKPFGKGTGLGLNITDKIIKAHGGCLRFESSAGEYTRVIIDLPVYCPPAGKAASQPAEGSPA